MATTAKATHTPGPWEAHFNVPTAAIPGHIVKVEAYPHRPIASLWVGGGQHGAAEQVANAHLIAAAPELLSTCEAVAHQLEHGEAGEGDERDIAWCVRELRAAIAKATA